MPTQQEIDSMRKVDGLQSMDKLAKQLCRIVSAFAPIIRNKFPENDALMAALLSAETMCSLLPEAVRDALGSTGDNTSLVVLDEIPGQDPFAILPPSDPE